MFYDSASGGFNAPVTHSILVSLYIVHIYIQHSYCLRNDTKERGVQERAVYIMTKHKLNVNKATPCQCI